jgi:hypothetical protein
MTQVPLWLEVAYRVATILGFVGGACAFLFVIWPSIRLQTKFIRDQEKKAVDRMLEDL